MVWRVSKAIGLKVCFVKGRERPVQTQGCLFSACTAPWAVWLPKSTRA